MKNPFEISAAAGVFAGCNCNCCSGGGAGSDCTYITQTPCSSLTAEQALSLLATGILKSTTGTGVVSIAVPGVDYENPLSFSAPLSRSGNVVSVLDSGVVAGTYANANVTVSSKGIVTAISTGGSSGFNLTVKEADSSPTFSNINTIEFNQLNGFSVTQPASGVARVNISGFLTPGGSPLEFQFNNSGVLGGATGFRYQGVTDTNVLLTEQATRSAFMINEQGSDNSEFLAEAAPSLLVLRQKDALTYWLQAFVNDASANNWLVFLTDLGRLSWNPQPSGGSIDFLDTSAIAIQNAGAGADGMCLSFVKSGSSRNGQLQVIAPNRWALGWGTDNSVLGTPILEWDDNDVTINVDTTISGKLTVTGVIDPTAVILSGGSSLYFESDDSSAATAAAGKGRFRYNNTIKNWQYSADTGAWTTFGNMTGAASSTDNALARFDGTTGKIIQNSLMILSDLGVLSGGALGPLAVLLGSDATGDIWYRNVSGFLTRLPIGTANQVLSVSGGLPSWTTISTTNSWSDLLSPSGNLSLTMADHTSLFTYNATTGSNNLFKLTTGSDDTGTGYVLSVFTPGSSNTKKPFGVVARGTAAFEVTATGAPSGPGTDGAPSERYGASSVALNGGQVFGNNSSATGVFGGAVTFGASATNSGSNNVLIGTFGNTNGHSQVILIGRGVTSSFDDTIVLATNPSSPPTAAHQMVVGSNTSAITDLFLGQGVVSSINDADFTIHPTSGFSTDRFGTNLVLAGGQGTGLATPGKITFKTSDPGSTGSTLQTLATRMEISDIVTVSVASVNTPVTLTDAAPIATNAKLGNRFKVSSAVDRTLDVPSNPTNGQQCTWTWINTDSSSHTLTLSTSSGGFTGSDQITLPLPATNAGKRIKFTAEYDSDISFWVVLGVSNNIG